MGSGAPLPADCGFLAPTSSTFNARAAACQPICHNDPNVSNHIFSFRGGDRKADQADTYFNTAACTLYSRYAPKDWEASNQSKLSMSEQSRGHSERVRTDAWQSIKEVSEVMLCHVWCHHPSLRCTHHPNRVHSSKQHSNQVSLNSQFRLSQNNWTRLSKSFIIGLFSFVQIHSFCGTESAYLLLTPIDDVH